MASHSLLSYCKYVWLFRIRYDFCQGEGNIIRAELEGACSSKEPTPKEEYHQEHKYLLPQILVMMNRSYLGAALILPFWSLTLMLLWKGMERTEKENLEGWRTVFCSHLPWGKSIENSVVQVELVQISTGLKETVVLIYKWRILPSFMPYS